MAITFQNTANSKMELLGDLIKLPVITTIQRDGLTGLTGGELVNHNGVLEKYNGITWVIQGGGDSLLTEEADHLRTPKEIRESPYNANDRYVRLNEISEANSSQFGADVNNRLVLTTPFIPTTGNIVSFNVNNILGTFSVPNTSTELAFNFSEARVGNQCIVFSQAATTPAIMFSSNIVFTEGIEYQPNQMNILIFTFVGAQNVLIKNSPINLGTGFEGFFDSLTAAYLMESLDPVVEETGNHAGTNLNVTLGAGKSGGNAFVYNGLNNIGTASVTTIPTSLVLNPAEEITFSFDMYPSAEPLNNYKQLVAKNGNTTGSWLWGCLMELDRKLTVRFITGTTVVTGFRIFNSSLTVPLNEWTRVLVVIKRATPTKIYMKTVGQAIASEEDVTSYADGFASNDQVSSPVRFGQDGNQTRTFEGRVDNVHIWVNRAFTQGEAETWLNEDLNFTLL